MFRTFIFVDLISRFHIKITKINSSEINKGNNFEVPDAQYFSRNNCTICKKRKCKITQSIKQIG